MKYPPLFSLGIFIPQETTPSLFVLRIYFIVTSFVSYIGLDFVENSIIRELTSTSMVLMEVPPSIGTKIMFSPLSSISISLFIICSYFFTLNPTPLGDSLKQLVGLYFHLSSLTLSFYLIILSETPSQLLPTENRVPRCQDVQLQWSEVCEDDIPMGAIR